MRIFSHFPYFATSFAVFSMFFGAGNVVFPLVLGRALSDQLLFALLGLGVTAVILPMIGLISIVMYEGEYGRYFGRIGSKLGLVLICLIMLLIGPFGAIPRIIALSHSTWEASAGEVPFFIFGAGFCIIMLLMTYQFTSIMRILGYILTPALLFFLSLIIVIGFINMPALPIGIMNFSQDYLAMANGAKIGYNTLDLLGALAFGAVIVPGLKAEFTKHSEDTAMQHVTRHTTISCIIAGVLLILVYGGLSVLAAAYGSDLENVNEEQLITALSFRILGEHAGIVANATVILACLTTGVALSAAFADFLNRGLKQYGNYYHTTLILTIIISFIVAFLGFSKIVELLVPVLFVCYPLLIVLVLCNIAYKKYNFTYVKTPAAIAFLGSLIIFYLTN